MEIKKTLILDRMEPLSKALSHLSDSPAVIVTKGGRYYGVIDHRSVSRGIRDPRGTKCETAIVKPPVIPESAGVLELVNAFLQGHFKALPVVDEKQAPVGMTTRVELLKDMQKERLIPKGSVSDLMSSPVYTINEGETIGKAKAVLKERGARRLVVTRRGHPIGVVSTFDIAAWKGKPNFPGGRKDIHASRPLDIDKVEISGFVRPNITVVKEATTLEDAVDRMIDKEVSGVIVASGKRAVGVLSALDIFKTIQGVARERADIHISGLGEDTRLYYDAIKSKIGGAIEKFSKAFNIRNCSIHVKEKKSTFIVSVYFDTDEGHVSLKGERATLKETVDELAYEVDKVLNKKKDMRLLKPRATHYGGMSGTYYKRRGKK